MQSASPTRLPAAAPAAAAIIDPTTTQLAQQALAPIAAQQVVEKCREKQHIADGIDWLRMSCAWLPTVVDAGTLARLTRETWLSESEQGQIDQQDQVW